MREKYPESLNEVSFPVALCTYRQFTNTIREDAMTSRLVYCACISDLVLAI